MEDCEEPATSWLLTRDSLYSDAIVNYPPNVAILRYFETLAAKSLVPYEAKNKFAPGLHDLLEQFISEDSRLTSELEQLLSLALQPEHLYAFDDSRIIPACMKLLETYCLENRLLGGAYGYLCLRILVITLQVDVLIQHDELDEFIEDQLSAPAQDHLLTLSEYVADLLHTNLSTWDSETPLEEMTFSTRGLTLEHAGFLYRKLTLQRRVLTAARVLYPERFHGWSILFHMILVLLRESGHFNCSDLPDDHECPRRVFQDLVSRFWLVESSAMEEDLLDELFWSVYEQIGRHGVELKDSRAFYEECPFLCKAYALRVLPTSGINLFDIQSTASLFQWIMFCCRSHTLSVMPAIFTASLLRISEVCQDENDLIWAATEFTTFILVLANTILSEEKTSEYYVACIAEVFLEINLVNLIGRVLLLATQNAYSELEYEFLGMQTPTS